MKVGVSMIQGIGIDIVELERISTVMKKQERFVSRILTENEQILFKELKGNRQIEFVAGRFAAKESFAKALGTGIGKEVGFLDIEVLPNQVGKPIMTGPTTYTIHVAISHSATSAIAQVILES